MADPLLVPRRRVPVQLQLADGHTISGEAYVAIDRGDGHHERLVDRLNDTSERFVPIAVADRHFLVRKSSVVSAFTTDRSEAEAIRATMPAGEIRVEVTLSGGRPVSGGLPTVNHSAHDRPLDHLNRLTGDFVAVVDREGITIVNTHHVVAVSDKSASHTAATPTLARSIASRDVGQPQ